MNNSSTVVESQQIRVSKEKFIDKTIAVTGIQYLGLLSSPCLSYWKSTSVRDTVVIKEISIPLNSFLNHFFKM